MASTVVQGSAPGRAIADPPAERSAPGAPRPGVWLTNALLLLMVLIWGINFSVLKVGTRYLAPIAFNGARLLLATAILLAVALAQSARRPSRGDIVRLVLLGVLGHGLYQVCFIEGLARTSAGATALVLAAGPAFVGIVGRVLGIEHPSRRAWAGIGLQLAGMAGVVAGSATRGQQPGAESPLLGALLVLGAAVAWSFYAVLLKPLAERIDGIQLSAWTLVGGALTIGAAAVPSLARTDLGALPATAWFALLYCSVLAMVVAYLFYYRGVRVVGPVRTAMFSNLQPIVALVVAYLTLGERPGAAQLGGAALIAAGLLVGRR